MDQLAKQLNIDPIQLRIINGIKPGDTTPTQTVLTANNIGDVEKCVNRAKELIQWDEGQRIDSGKNKVRAKGISLFWKTSTTSTNAQAGSARWTKPRARVPDSRFRPTGEQIVIQEECPRPGRPTVGRLVGIGNGHHVGQHAALFRFEQQALAAHAAQHGPAHRQCHEVLALARQPRVVGRGQHLDRGHWARAARRLR